MISHGVSLKEYIFECRFNHVSCDDASVYCSRLVQWRAPPGRSDDLIGAFTGGGAPVFDLGVATAPLLLQVRAVAVQVSVGTWVG